MTCPKTLYREDTQGILLLYCCANYSYCCANYFPYCFPYCCANYS